MGQLTVSGLDSKIDDTAELAKLPNSVITDILNAETDVIIQAADATRNVEIAFINEYGPDGRHTAAHHKHGERKKGKRGDRRGRKSM